MDFHAIQQFFLREDVLIELVQWILVCTFVPTLAAGVYYSASEEFRAKHRRFFMNLFGLCGVILAMAAIIVFVILP